MLLWFTALLRRWTLALNEQMGHNDAMHDVIFDGVPPQQRR